MPNTRCELVVLAIGLAATAAHADGLHARLSPHAQVTSNISASQLEAGVEATKDNITHDIPETPAETSPTYRQKQVRLFVRVPVGSGSAATLDRTTSTARVGLRGTYSWSALPRPEATDAWCAHRLTLSGEYGVARYAHFPNGVEAAKQSPVEQSFAFEGEYRRVLVYQGGHQYVPQVRVRYARDWQAAGAVDVVVPGTPPAPDTTRSMVLEPPTVAPQLSVRIALPFSHGSEFGFAPGLKYTLTGAANGFAPSGDVQRARAEWFIYYSPSGFEKGGRIGVSPFVDVRVSGTDDLRRVELGGLVDLRLGTNLLEY